MVWNDCAEKLSNNEFIVIVILCYGLLRMVLLSLNNLVSISWYTVLCDAGKTHGIFIVQ